ncbi:MAG: hypothetical protein CML16_14855 [Pusillimonas sp.]|nr:hypothetical protein [Pusillimonas sp.]MBC42818.1 hypothetical protein [Pusillimonas sp.]HCP79412.1 hypothetical protein [Pusillimonas sp.]|tara:strand:+ start:11709 stop:12467 length:759 start_codon:yes stop_codon:yes gene_type:complete
MDKYETRYYDLVALRDKLGRGGIAKIASAIGKEPSYVSRMLYPVGKPGRKRIGEDTAEILDQNFPEWRGLHFNTDAQAARRPIKTEIVETKKEGVFTRSQRIIKRGNVAVFDVLDVMAACGNGAVNSDYPEIVSSISMPIDQAKILIGTSNANNSIQIIVATKDSMAPTIEPNDLLFVDTKVSEYVGESIYILLHGGELVCKRLSLVGKSLVVISDNQSYPSWNWEDKPDQTRIVGKVIRALPMNFKNFGGN